LDYRVFEIFETRDLLTWPVARWRGRRGFTSFEDIPIVQGRKTIGCLSKSVL